MSFDETKPKPKRIRAREVHELVMACYRKMGGLEALTKWATDNPTQFYTKVFVKLVPLQIAGKLTVADERKPQELSTDEILARLREIDDRRRERGGTVEGTVSPRKLQ